AQPVHRRRDVGHAQRDGVLWAVVTSALLFRRAQHEADVVGRELRPLVVRERVPPEAESIAVEVASRGTVADVDADEIGALDLLVGGLEALDGRVAAVELRWFPSGSANGAPRQ